MSSTPTSDPEKKVDVFDEDDAVLAQLGYTQGEYGDRILDQMLTSPQS